MTTNEIHSALDEMVSNPKTKNFFNHLVGAYFPITKSQMVYNKPKNNFKCVITQEDLLTIKEIVSEVKGDEFDDGMIKSFKGFFNEGSNANDNPMIALVGDKCLGITGKDTTTFMSYPALKVLSEWIKIKSEDKDKHINWLLGSIKRAEVVKTDNTNSTDVKVKTPNLKREDSNSKNRIATYSLGDMSALQMLKEKMDKNGN